MNAEDRVADPLVYGLMERAATITGASVALHPYRDGREEAVAARCGTCVDACAYVSRLPWGPQACRMSREKAGASALRRGKPVPFVCHMGFSCVAASARTADESNAQVLTLGPFCPSEAPDSLELDAREGLAKLDSAAHDALPFDLAQIPLCSANAVPAVADWLVESIENAVMATANSTQIDSDHGVPQPDAPRRARRSPRAHRDPYQAGDIAAALAAGDQDRARTIVRRLIEDTESPKRMSLRLRRAKTVAVAAAVLEAAERAALDTRRAWDAFAGLQTVARDADGPRALTLAAMKVLGELKRSAVKNRPAHRGYAALNDLLDESPEKKLSLETVASQLGQKPSTLTKRLQRTFGMSFSEYVGRRRVDRAKEMLCVTRLTVAEIARRVGLNDASNLGKLFRKYEGSSPGAYRKHFGPKTAKELTGTH